MEYRGDVISVSKCSLSTTTPSFQLTITEMANKSFIDSNNAFILISSTLFFRASHPAFPIKHSFSAMSKLVFDGMGQTVLQKLLKDNYKKSAFFCQLWHFLCSVCANSISGVLKNRAVAVPLMMGLAGHRVPVLDPVCWDSELPLSFKPLERTFCQHLCDALFF